MKTVKIKAPLPGVIYHAPDPSSKPFKSPGDIVAVGETLVLIEVMKSFMPVAAEVDGVFVSYSAPDGSTVEPGDELCELEVK